jgi:hypothetical protein
MTAARRGRVTEHDPGFLPMNFTREERRQGIQMIAEVIGKRALRTSFHKAGFWGGLLHKATFCPRCLFPSGRRLSQNEALSR